MSEERLRAAIVGCGQIAGGYDENSPQEYVLTHAKAYAKHPATELVAVADVDTSRAERFASQWSVPRAFTDVRAMLAEMRPDLVSICTPDDTHADLLELCLDWSPRAVWCEKPIVTDAARGKELVAKFERRGIPLAVNYHRRWTSALQRVGEAIRGIRGDSIRASVIYGKGLRHSGSHAVDLLLDWLGPVRRVRALGALIDYRADDPTVSAWLEFQNGAQAHLIGNDERQYTLWEIDVLGPAWRYRITQAGLQLETYTLRTDPVFAGCKELDPAPVISETDLHTALYRALDNIVGAVQRREPLHSSGRSALETLKVCDKILYDLGR